MLATSMSPVFGIEGTDCASGIERSPAVPAHEVGPSSDIFFAVVAVYQSNEFLLNELKLLTRRLERARIYLDSPARNRAFAEANLLRLKARRSAALTILRANRSQARGLLAGVGGAGF